MKNFEREDDCLFCNNEEKNEYHETKIMVECNCNIEFDIEGSNLIDPQIIKLNPQKVYVTCLTCGNQENITDQVKITEDETYTRLYNVEFMTQK